jgi:hypothetical protein
MMDRPQMVTWWPVRLAKNLDYLCSLVVVYFAKAQRARAAKWQSCPQSAL